MAHLLIKTVASVTIIRLATGIARRFPSMAGLIGVMPLTSVLVLVWVYVENNGDKTVMHDYVTGSLLGIVPTILFFLVVLIGFKKGFPLYGVLLGGFAAWLTGAVVHQFLLR
jgi:hypothetical protein